MNLSYKYLIQFLIGGIIFTMLFHFTREKNTLISSIIPSFPLFFLFTLLYIIYFNANITYFLKNICITNSLLYIFVVSIYLSFIYFNNIFLSIITSFTAYILILNYCIKNKIIK